MWSERQLGVRDLFLRRINLVSWFNGRGVANLGKGILVLHIEGNHRKMVVMVQWGRWISIHWGILSVCYQLARSCSISKLLSARVRWLFFPTVVMDGPLVACSFVSFSELLLLLLFTLYPSNKGRPLKGSLVPLAAFSSNVDCHLISRKPRALSGEALPLSFPGICFEITCYRILQATRIATSMAIFSKAWR